MSSLSDIIRIDTDNYMFLDDKEPECRYRHKYIVEGTASDKLGNDTKWSKHTLKNAREFALEYDVRIVETSKQPLPGRGRKRK